MSAGKILIVEDDKDLRYIYELILKRGGYDTRTAENGRIGLDELASFEPDVVVLDIFMPVMDGKAFLQNAKLPASTSMVVCSNTSDRQLLQEMTDLGAKQVVNKSNMDPSDLLALVKPYFEG